MISFKLANIFLCLIKDKIFYNFSAWKWSHSTFFQVILSSRIPKLCSLILNPGSTPLTQELDFIDVLALSILINQKSFDD